MKLLNYLFALCLLLGIGACHDDKESDQGPQKEETVLPVLSFKEKSMTVAENGGTLNVPLILTKPSDTTTVVYVYIKKGSETGGIEGVPYVTISACITLQKGVTEGFVTLQTIDNDTLHPDRAFDLEITDVRGKVTVDPAASTCRITIRENEFHHSLRFGGPVNDSTWHEEAGTIEVPLLFTYGDIDNKNISGKIVIDSIYGCTASDIELLTTEFAVNGEDKLPIKIKLADNETLGNWGFRLTLKDLDGVSALYSSFIVRIKDDERILGFKPTTYTVNEGKSISIMAALKGGVALMRIPLNVEVVADQTTALPEQYAFPPILSPLYEGTSIQPFNLSTYKHPSQEDKVLTLKVTTTAGTASPYKILADDTQICKVIIKNTDE